jgi:hypothetical protein
MDPNQYLNQLILKHHVDTGPQSLARQMRGAFLPLLQQWAGQYLISVEPSGSFAKGTAVRTGTDIDLFISLHPSTPDTLESIHVTLMKALRSAGLTPKPQTVSIGVRSRDNRFDVDLVPAKMREDFNGDHSLYHRKSGTVRKTNIERHISTVAGSGRLNEIKVLKLWCNQQGLEFPSFYLELATIEALAGRSYGQLADNVWHTFSYLRDTFPNARSPDPAVPSNAVSDDLTMAGRLVVKRAAEKALSSRDWSQIII